MLPVTNEQAKALTAGAGLGVAIVTETANLARYVGWVLGTAPADAIGIVAGEPLHAIRTLIAGILDEKVKSILQRRRVMQTQGVSPSIGLPLLRAACDESREELQDLWAALIAAAMDPGRSSQVRLSFIETLRRFDPLDAMILKVRNVDTESGNLKPVSMAFLMEKLNILQDEALISISNLEILRCIEVQSHSMQFILTPYGRSFLHACSD